MTVREASPGAGGPTQGASEGLSDAELEAETAEELPDREAMSIVGLPGMLLPPTAPIDVADVPDPIEPTNEPVDRT